MKESDVPGVLLDGERAPEDGSLPPQVALGADTRPFGVYVHVPYCRVRCGYCDFNTYTALEVGGARREDFAGTLRRELYFGAEVMRQAGIVERSASTVFFGGGTPTLLPVKDLVWMLDGVRQAWGVSPHAEITTEANPDSVDAQYLQALAAGGFTRVSFGMQSAVPHVLSVLDRTHSPSRVPFVVRWAREAGLQVSLDLIYGTPGESLEDWECSLDSALEMNPDHISAYALSVERGTKLSARIGRGELENVDDDMHAEMYELADARFRAAGFNWYEISNWSSSRDTRSRHNLSYWTGGDWWAAGPGAHSHVGGVRWWNVKHPGEYARRIALGVSPALAREVLGGEARRQERVLLETRTVDGLPLTVLTHEERMMVSELVAEGLLEGDAAASLGGGEPRAVPTLRGRLLADTVLRRLLG